MSTHPLNESAEEKKRIWVSSLCWVENGDDKGKDMDTRYWEEFVGGKVNRVVRLSSFFSFGLMDYKLIERVASTV